MKKIIFKYINLKEFVTYNELHKTFGLSYKELSNLFKHRFLQVNQNEFIIYDKRNHTIFTKYWSDWKHYFYKDDGTLDHIEYSPLTFYTSNGTNSYIFGMDTASSGESMSMGFITESGTIEFRET